MADVEVPMIEAAVDRVIETYRMMSHSTAELSANMRSQLENYLRMLFEGGQTDPTQLTIFGLTYLREKDGKSDPVRAGFTGL
jgi:hypothetical protein